MLFNSLQFLIFLPFILLITSCFPRKKRYLVYLFASYYFYMCMDPVYAIVLLLVTVTTYVCAKEIGKDKAIETGGAIRGKGTLTAGVIINAVIYLSFLKFDFLHDKLLAAFHRFGISIGEHRLDLFLPLSVLMLTLQALSYLIDVYRGEIEAEDNFFRVALLVAFFPKLIVGPIVKAKDFFKQMYLPARITFENFVEGVLLMIWGYFVKIVVADRIAVFVDVVYGNYTEYKGWYLIVATLFLGIYMYCNFLGYTTIAQGVAKILGFELPDNFEQPFFAVNVKEYWRKWFTSLHVWFKEYVYIPLGGSKNGTTNYYRNVLIIFMTTGLLQGIGISYLIWGMLNAFYIIIGDVLSFIRNILCKMFGINPENGANKFIKAIFTILLIDFAWIFIRAGSLADAGSIIGSIFTATNPEILFDGSLFGCGVASQHFQMMMIFIGVVCIVDILKARGVVIRHAIMKQDAWCQVLVVAFSVLAILLFGSYALEFRFADLLCF